MTAQELVTRQKCGRLDYNLRLRAARVGDQAIAPYQWSESFKALKNPIHWLRKINEIGAPRSFFDCCFARNGAALQCGRDRCRRANPEDFAIEARFAQCESKGAAYKSDSENSNCAHVVQALCRAPHGCCNRPDLFHHFRKLIGPERLRTVAQRVIG